MLEELIFFVVIIGASFLMPMIARKVKISYVTSLVIAGILVGPAIFGLIPFGETARFLSVIGAIFVMLLAGLDVKLSSLPKLGNKVAIIASLNSIIPALVALILALIIGYDWIASTVLAIIFMSSSVGVIMPSLIENKMVDMPFAKVLKGAIAVDDIVSLFFFAVMLQVANPIPGIPLPIFLIILFSFLVTLFVIVPHLAKFYVAIKKSGETQKMDVFEKEFTFLFMIVMFASLVFEYMGMNASIAAFAVGILLSDTIKRRLVYDKIHTIAYAFFIPFFFLSVGLRLDFTVFATGIETIAFSVAVVICLIISKFFSGFLGGKIARYTNSESYAIGASSIPQMSSSLVVAFIAMENGLIDSVMLNSIIIMSIVTTLAGPFLMRHFYKDIQREKLAKNP